MAGAALWLAQAQQGGTIVVSVTDELTGQPVSLARIDAHSVASGRTWQQRSDQFGVARLSQLQSGNYVLDLTRTGYVSSGEGGRRYHVTVGAAGEVKIAATMQPKASISGRVLGEDSEPLEGVYVQAEQDRGIPLSATSGKGGAYEIANLLPGDFRIRLQFPVAQIRASLRTKAGENWGYPNSLWHPGVESRMSAATVTLTPGLTLTGFDLRARRELLVNIGGELIDQESRQPLTTADVELRPEIGGLTDEGFGRRPARSGSAAFVFSYTRPGRHSLLVYRGESKSELPYVVPLDVGRAGLSGSRLSIPRFGRIAGRVHPTPPPRSEVALLGPAVGMGRQTAPLSPDGTFVFDDVPPGPLRFEGEFPGFFIKAVRFSGRDIVLSSWLHDLIMPEALSTGLEVTISNRTGAITGRVIDDKDEPVPQHRVKVSPYRFGTTTTDQAGAFSVDALAPGDYVVSACDGREEHVRVEAGAQAAVSLRTCAK